LNFGALLHSAYSVAEKNDYSVYDMRWVKPLDTSRILEVAEQYDHIVTIEENMIAGGAGSSVQELLNSEGISSITLNIGLPDKNFDQGSRSTLLSTAQLDIEGIDNQQKGKKAKTTKRLEYEFAFKS